MKRIQEYIRSFEKDELRKSDKEMMS